MAAGGCGRQWCSCCGEEMIHRDNRHHYESASALGQIVWREGPSKLSVADIDLAARKGLKDGSQLLRIVEQKQPKHRLRDAQEKILRLVDAVITHCRLCPEASDMQLDRRSGVYIVRGNVSASSGSSRRETTFDGPQEIERFADGQTRPVRSHEEFFRFLDPEDNSRRNRRAELRRQRGRSTRRGKWDAENDPRTDLFPEFEDGD